MEQEVLILPVNPDTFETQEYNTSDQDLLTVSELDTVFSSSTDYIEICIYDENQNKIYATPEGEVLTTYNVKEGDVLLNPQQDLERLGFDIDSYFINYNFYRKRLNSDSTQKYFINQISSDRTEIALDSNSIELDQILTSTAEFIQFRENADYFVDFYLNFGSNQSVIANNIKLDNEQVLIKLYEPLPAEFGLKSTLWVVEEISTPQAYQVTFPFTPEIPDDFTFISGPNFNLKIQGETGTTSQDFSYNTLIDSNITSSVNQIQSLLAEKQININVNYEDFSQFIHFSSAQTRLENFYYKVGLIESASNQLSSFLNQITSDTTNTTAYSSSKAELTSQIDSIIKNFDGYEYFLYFNSGSQFSYPKSNTEPPFILYSTGSSEVLNWIGSADPSSPYYGGIALSASDFDQENKDWLYWAIPEYLRTDPDNLKYELFVDMVGQHYDNIWLYTKDITNKFDADNRLEYGISKDLVADAIKDFGVKLYSNNFNTNDLYTAFLGLTPSGSLFPFPEITGSLPVESGYEYVDTRISASNEVIPLNDVNKRLYKRIYHNIPYLLKTKGTIAGLRALITSYGIPDTILRVNEFGGKDRNEAQDWDLEQNVFNYAFDTGVNSTNFVSSSFVSNTNFGADRPNSFQLRFKSSGIPTASNNIASSDIRYSQSLFLAGTSGESALVLEYTGSGLTSGSYSGSSVSPYDLYGTLKWIPDTSDANVSASVYLPFFDKNWWSIQVNITESIESTLFAANELNGKIGFLESSSVTGFDETVYFSTITAFLNTSSDYTPSGAGGTYQPFSGSFQELRYFKSQLSESVFLDYVVNPYSNEGNTLNSTPNELFFRAALGTQLDTGSRTSIHPRVTGSSSQITQSFSNNSSFYINNDEWVPNREKIYQDQVVAGIKNRVTDKVETEDIIIAEAPYGFTTDSSSFATKSSENALSPFQSIQTTSYISQSYTPDVNYLEVAFSPQNQINDDINAQIGYFNIGDYIGDPRQISSSARSYPDLDAIRDAYFEKYIKSYDVVDFVRLIKFFDNSLFKMIKDFTPARTSLSSGVVVKQHILERNRQRPAQASWSNETYSGSIKPQSRNYNTGSGDVGQYESTDGSSIYKFTGGTGGSFERFNGLQSYPESLNNRFSLTQSYSESIEGSVANTINNSGSFQGYRDILVSDQKEFYDGEFSGSNLEVTNLIANPGCSPYLKVTDKSIFFNPLFFNLTSGGPQGTTTEEEITLNVNSPTSGDAWIISRRVQTSPTISKVQYIKLSNIDNNGVFIGDYLDDSDTIKLVTPDANVADNGGVVEYKIEGVTTFAKSVLLRISQTQGDNIVFTTGSDTYYPITSSINGGSENWSLIARGSFTSSTSLSESNDNIQQGNFINPAASDQIQYFWYYDSNIDDAQSFFNTGSESVNLSNILSDPTKFEFGTYNPQRTSNIPWYFSCSISYSASDLGTGTSITSSGNIYHSASHYSGIGLTDQNFIFRSTPIPFGITESGLFIPSPSITNLNSSIFKTTYNNLIPGDSGSEAGLVGGHPKIKIPGTASIDFYYPSLTLGGTQRELLPDFPLYSSLSGSTLEAGNDDFNSDVPNNGFVNWSGSALGANSGEYTDGAISIDDDGIKTFLNLLLGYNPNNITIQYIELDDINFTITGSQPFTASLFERAYSDQTGDDEDEEENLYGGFLENGFASDSNNKVEVIGENINVRARIPAGGTSGIGTSVFLKIKPHGQDQTSMDYWVTTFSADTIVHYTYLGSSYTLTGYGGWNSTDFQGAISDKANFDFKYISSGDDYPSVDITAQLRRTGSGIPEGGYLIASSVTVTNEKIFGGQTFTFTGSFISPDPGFITNIFSDDPLFQFQTINNEDDMYFIAYSMSNYNDRGAGLNTTFDIEFIENGDTGSAIIIEQRAESGGSGNEYDLTGSILISHGENSTPTSVGDIILTQNFIVPESNSIDTVTLSGSFSYPFRYDDAFRMGVNVSKSFGSGLTITEYSMSIFPSSSVYAPLPSMPEYDYYRIPTSSGFIIPTYFGANILPFNLALDCQPLLNNYNDIRTNTFMMDVDYNNLTGSITPVNQSQLLNFSATKASIPDSNYTSLKSINPRYNGVKTTSNQLNVWTIKDTNTYGQNPVIELRDAYFGYFKSIDDLYPLVNDKISFELTYLLDEQSNAIPPSLDANGIDLLTRTFPTINEVTLGFISSSKLTQELSDNYSIFKLTEKPTPIFYTQTSSAGYASEIPLTGSGRISMYDNNDASSFTDYSFIAQGTSSFANDPGPNQSAGIYTQVLNPTEDVTMNPYSAGSYTDPYSSRNGTMTFTGDIEKNPQTISMQTSFATSFLYESGTTELRVDVQMLSGSAGVNFDLEDVSLKVYRTGQNPVDLGSIIGTRGGGTEDVLRFIGDTVVTQKPGLFRRTKRSAKVSHQKLFNSQRGSYYFIVENYAMDRFLSQRGVYTLGRGGSQFNGDITGLEFIIKANSGNYLIEDGDNIKFQLKIDMPRSRQEAGNVLFPTDYTGPIFPVKISTIGERTALLAGDNTGSAPFWVYTGSAGGGSSIIDQSILVMSSSNINEAYGGAFYQGPLPYVPGPTEYFDQGTEPVGTQFPKIVSPIEFLPGDEIRFGNNENHSYKILEITPPEVNIEGDGKGRIKIRLDGKVPQSINKDFFLIRRYEPKASSFIIDAPFPYSAESSGSSGNGIIYPTFPTNYIQNSGSIIVTDLISKGVIT